MSLTMRIPATLEVTPDKSETFSAGHRRHSLITEESRHVAHVARPRVSGCSRRGPVTGESPVPRRAPGSEADDRLIETTG